MYAIETDKLSKSYGKARGITEVSLKVDEGDFFGFIGPNGAGKSTLIRTMLGLLGPTAGEAKILGMDIVRDNIKILDNVGYLPSEATFYGGLRVSDIIKFSAKLRGGGFDAEAAMLCDRLQLDVTKKVRQLSLGNRKKLGIVCAMQHRPKLYIMDEPTSGLDPLIQHVFFELLKERNKEGATVFLSSHNLNEVSAYCNKAAIIRDGSLIVSDTVDKLSHSDVKRIFIKGLHSGKPEAIPEIRNLHTENGNLGFLYEGDMHKLTEMLSAMDFDDFTVTNPELEEIFMHFYEKEDK